MFYICIRKKSNMEKLNKVFKINPLYEADGYKPGHKGMLADNTVREYWTWIPRNLKYMHHTITKIMSAGQQLTWRYIHSTFQESFFNVSKEEALSFVKDMSTYMGMEYEGSHFSALYDLGYLPVKIQAIPEGTFTNPNIPHMAGINTVDGYAWLGLFLETLVSKLSWQMPTAATMGHKFKENAVRWTLKTDKDNIAMADFMCHDFHSRGGNPFTSIAVGLGHAFSNSGSDTLNVIPASRYYYDFDEDKTPIYGVNASEHSVTCTGLFLYEHLLRKGKLDSEIKAYYEFDAPSVGSIDKPDFLAIAELLNLRDWLKKFPDGILSVVSDTMDLWKLITHVLPRLKAEIMARNGKLVIRPDSGDPVDITCGTDGHITDISEYFPEGEVLPEYFREYLLGEVDDETPHGELGVSEYSQTYKIRGKVYEASITDISWNRYDKQYYFMDDNNYLEVELVEVEPTVESKGVIELLGDIFGYTVNSQGYKVLDSHIGAIYGDSINLDRQIQMYERLVDKEFAATNIVVGVGSFTYVLITRDQAGYAAKGAWFEILKDGERKGFNIYKDPITDDGTKTSLKGFQLVTETNGVITTKGEVTEEEAFSPSNLLKTIYEDGKFYNQVTLTEIREKLNNGI